MSRKSISAFALSISLVVGATYVPASGQDYSRAFAEREGVRHWALIVAIDGYPSRFEPGEPLAAPTGRELAHVLVDRYGYEPEAVFELVAGEARVETLFAATRTVERFMGPDDSFLGYFAAPVVQDGWGDLSLVVNGEPEEWEESGSQGVAYAPLTTIMQAARGARETLLVFDGCFRAEALLGDLLYEAGKGLLGAMQVIPLCTRSEEGPLSEEFGMFLDGILGDAAGPDGTVSVENLLDYFEGRVAGTETPFRRWNALDPDPWGEQFRFVPQYSDLLQELRERIGGSAIISDRLDAIEALARVARTGTAEDEPVAIETVGGVLRETAHNPNQPMTVRSSAILAISNIPWDSAPETLGELAQSDDPPIRFSAVEALRALGNSGGLPYLYDALEDTDPVVRESAVRGIAESGDALAGIRLLEFIGIETEPEVLISAIQSLTTIAEGPQDQVWSGLLPLLDHPDPRVRRQVVLTFDRQGVVRARTRILERYRTDPDPSVKEAAAYALGRLWGTEDRQLESQAQTALIIGLDNPNASVKEASAFALGEAGSQEAEPHLLRKLNETAESPYVRAAAARGLGSLGSEQAVSALASHLREERNHIEVRLASAEALREIGSAPAVDALLQVLDDPNPSVRRFAQSSFASIGQTEDSAAISALVNNPSPDIRAQVARSLSVDHSPETAEYLIGLLGDDDYDVRQEAIRGLASFPEDMVVPPLSEALHGGDVLTQRSSATALGLVQSPWALEVLVEYAALEPVNSLVQTEVMRSLGGFEDDQVIDPLFAGARALDENVRKAALAGISQQIIRMYRQYAQPGPATELAWRAREELAEQLGPEEPFRQWLELFLLESPEPRAGFGVEIDATYSNAVTFEATVDHIPNIMLRNRLEETAFYQLWLLSWDGVPRLFGAGRTGLRGVAAGGSSVATIPSDVFLLSTPRDFVVKVIAGPEESFLEEQTILSARWRSRRFIWYSGQWVMRVTPGPIPMVK